MERLLVELTADGLVVVSEWRGGEAFPSQVGEPVPLEWPLDARALDDLRWYLEEYLRAPFGVYSERGPRIAGRLPEWGARVFEALFGAGPARSAYVRARARARTGGGSLEIVLRSRTPQLLGLPWELMADPGRPTPVALDRVAVTRSLPSAELGEVFTVGGSRLRVLMVISRPHGEADVGYRMIARPLLHRLEAVRGSVELVVLRPPTLERLGEVLAEARAAGRPFQIVHFDGHGVFGEPAGPASGWNALTFTGPGPRGMLAFERPGGGADLVPVEQVARVLARARVPVVILNACQSAVIGSQLEAAVATRLLQEGAGAVVAMAYSVYAVAAAEFMAAFYERLFAGDRVADAVAAGRLRLAEHDRRPSPKGLLPLADWMVPVLYARSEVSFPGLRTERAGEESLGAVLDRIRERPAGGAGPAEGLAPAGAFVGRDGLLYTLDVAARLQRVVVLHGPGGVGKTELARAFGRWCRDTGAVDRPEWVLWHSFKPGVASFGLDGVVTDIGLHVYGAQFARLQDPAERRAVVEDLLATRRLLLLWDNFESVHTMPDPTAATPALSEEDRGALRGFLEHVARDGRSAVVITSRTPETWLGEVRRIEVPGLEAEEATQYAELLLAPYPRAGRRREQRSFGELMQWLAGHPDSMRIVLPHLDARDPQDLLAGLQGTDPLPEHESGSLSAGIAYSFDHLPAADQRRMTALSLFHGVADADVLGLLSQDPAVPERFRGCTAEDWHRLLRRAVEIGLLTELGGGMYRIHPALPAYLAARWRHEEPDGHGGQRRAATLALLNAYTDLSVWLERQLTGGNAQFAVALIDLQRRTLGNLLGYALDHGLWEQAVRVVIPLDAYWDIRGLFVEARGWVDRVRVAVEDSDGTPPLLDTPAGALWMFLVGSEASRQIDAHRLDQAESTYRDILQALREQPTSDWQRGHLSTSYHQLGIVAQVRGRLAEAGEWYRQSMAIEEERGNRHGMATSYHQLGIVAQDRGRLAEAEQWYRKCLAIEEELGDLPGMAGSYHQLGMVAEDRGELAEAEEWHRRSLAIKEELGNLPGMAGSYHQLGIVAQGWGRLEEAREWYRKSLAIMEELGNLPGMASSYHQLGIVAQLGERLEEAEDWYRKSLAMEEELGNLPGMASSYHQLGRVAQEWGRLAEAEEWHRRSLAIKEELGNLPGMARSYHQLGIIAQLQGRLEEAWEWHRKSLAIKEELRILPGMAASYGQLGLLFEQWGAQREALAWMVRCVACFAEFPHPATGPAPWHLRRLVAALGSAALEEVWREVTGEPLPAAVREQVCPEPEPTD
ncbi:tetratricopeptide repeat protein [Kitasatospora sp. NA04385]|uniref:CHAT domain-containing tetratricopeptide repeat protein n=1 Tax=Kitasatospora sp. NA04385 TaxID=2742135 RepID=UPI0015906D88|nr:tetratricopeptide repeat protein [Kitasatospora sp. NA04385]QKW20922.1 tetratricopeptide repeat protein [Kitasatospora sp. NA04385]